MEDLRGKKAVVIGGGSGIGRGIALGLADEGVDVAVADIEEDTARAVAGEIERRGVRSLAVRTDATQRASLEVLLGTATKALGDIQILSNNVGVVIDKPLADCTEKDWGWGIEFNFQSIVRGVSVFLPHLRAQRQGHIVSTASLAGVVAVRSTPQIPVHLGIYTATKHAIVGFSEVLRNELAPEGIGVSVLCPGLVKSNLGATSARNRPERYGGVLPPPRATPPELDGLMLPPEKVGPIVVAGIRANRLHIFTHPEARPLVEWRYRDMLDDFSFAATLPR